MTSEHLSSAARRTGRSGALKAVARSGYAVSGVLHLLIGWLAVRLATGDAGASADQSGALAQLASAPGGRVLLWVAVVAFAVLGLWELAEAVFGGFDVQGNRTAAARVKAGARAAVYLALAASTVAFAAGLKTSSSQQTTDFTASLMGSTIGRVLLVAIGLAVLAVAGYHCYKGVTRKFTDDLQGGSGGRVGTAVVVLGVVGYVAKGVALAVVGVLFIVAVLQSDPSEASGLDGALRTLGEQPYGDPLLVAVGLGIVAYGIYSFARARYARL